MLMSDPKKRLYGPEHERVDTVTLKVNSGLDNIKARDTFAHLRFVNGEFVSVAFQPPIDTLSREGVLLLEAVAAHASQWEASFAAPAAG